MKTIKQPFLAIKIIQEALIGLKSIYKQIAKEKENFKKEWNKFKRP